MFLIDLREKQMVFRQAAWTPGLPARCKAKHLLALFFTGKLALLLEDTLEIHDLVIDLVGHKEKEGVPLQNTLRYEAFTKLHNAAKRLAGTTLAELKAEGLETSFTDGDQLAFKPDTSWT
jgi:hypothetical protein